MTVHLFTVDVEEHFQVSAFEGVVRREEWPRLESRVERNVAVLLELLARHDVRGTFFTLGWIAEQRPSVVRAIADAGHEVASHGQDHRRVTHQTPGEFRASVRRSRAVLEDLTGSPVRGFRAPSFSIVPGREWAFDVLIEEGYAYDSSLFPIWRPDAYGYPSAPADAHWITRPSGRLYEIPMTTLRVGRWKLPASGGAYFRIFPYAWTVAALAACARRGVPGVLYIHPWEVDPAQPRVAAPLASRWRHYTGLRRTVPRLERLLAEHQFTTMGSTVPSEVSPGG